MATIPELITALHDPNNLFAAEFSIFNKPNLDIFDHYRFWLTVLQHHMIFISDRSKAYEPQAKALHDRVVQLKQALKNNGEFTINGKVVALIEDVRNFKRQILSDLLSGPPMITLPPTFLSHMLNELEKFRFIAYFIQVNGEFPPIYSLNEHELWITDIVGHLGGIKDNLDSVEKLLRKRLHEQKKIFHALHHKTLEFIGYAKHNVIGEASLGRLNNEAMGAVFLYLALVREVAELRSQNMALGIIDEGMLLHMIFEEIYYLKCLEVAAPGFDPLAACQLKPDPKSLTTINAMED